jgi:hypothetical protein
MFMMIFIRDLLWLVLRGNDKFMGLVGFLSKIFYFYLVFQKGPMISMLASRERLKNLCE